MSRYADTTGRIGSYAEGDRPKPKYRSAPPPPVVPKPGTPVRGRTKVTEPTSRRLAAVLDDKGFADSLGRRVDGFGDRIAAPPSFVLDAIAERTFDGGYRRTIGPKGARRSNLCPGCGEYRSVNGACGCRSKNGR